VHSGRGTNNKKEKRRTTFGDAGQPILLAAFFKVCVSDSFFLCALKFLFVYLLLYMCLAILGLALTTAVSLSRSGRVLVKHKQRPLAVLSSGASGMCRILSI
jgi:hypothetical protein